jgi:LysM repeat protein
MPTDLILLAGIESNYRPLEYSWAKAAGMWQFIPKTGLKYGMKRTPWRDERYNIQKAASGAMRYLRDLQLEFRQWEYAIAAYNGGEKCLRRVRRRCPGMTFWRARLLRRCTLPRETRQYVARFFALLYFMRHPHKGKSSIKLKPTFALKKKLIRGVVSLPTIAEGLGVTVKEMRQWNPELTSWATPPGLRYSFWVPPAHYDSLRSVLQRPSPHYRLKGLVVRSARGLERIGRRYNLSVAFLRAINHLPAQASYVGKRRLLVPLPRGARRWGPYHSQKLAAFANEIMPWSKRLRRFRRKMLKLKPEPAKQVCVQIESGDSYWHIAKRFGVPYRELMQYNRRKTLHPGKWLRLVAGVRCPRRPTFVRNWNRSLAKKQWDRGFRLLYLYPRPGWERRYRKRRQRRKRWTRKRRRRLARTNKRRRKSRRRLRKRRACHKVRSGETLWSIARKYRVTTRRLLKLNPSSHRILRKGSWIRIRPRVTCRR